MADSTPEAVRISTGPDQYIAADHWPAGVAAAGRSSSPVILAHGGGQTRHSWGGTAAVLAGHGHRVVSIDLRGHGDSTWARDGEYSMGAYCSDALSVAEWIRQDSEAGPIAWVGASLGGMTGLHVVDAAPAWFSSLTLVDITPRPAVTGVNRILDFMAAKADEGFATLEEAADAIAEYQPHRPRPKDLSGLAKNLRRRDDGRWRWHWDPKFLRDRSGSDSEHARDRHHDELERMARRLTMPTMLIRGKLSDLVTQSEVDAFLDMVPHANFVDVKDAAHMIAGDKNDVFTDAVVEFLDG